MRCIGIACKTIRLQSRAISMAGNSRYYMPLDSIHFRFAIRNGTCFFFLLFSSRGYFAAVNATATQIKSRNRYYSIRIIAQIGLLFISRVSPHPRLGWKREDKRCGENEKEKTNQENCLRSAFVYHFVVSTFVLSIHAIVVSFVCVLYAEIPYCSIVVICGDVIKCQKCKS